MQLKIIYSRGRYGRGGGREAEMGRKGNGREMGKKLNGRRNDVKR